MRRNNADLLRKRRAARLVAERDIPALDALPVFLEIGLDDDSARAPANGAPSLDGGNAVDLDRSRLQSPLQDLGLLDAVADRRLNGPRR